MKFISALKAERCISALLAESDQHTPAAQKALNGLKNSGPGAIPIMIDALATADRYQAIGIVDALTAHANDQNFKFVAKGLSHPNDRSVAGAARALADSHDYNVEKLPQILTVDDVATHAVLDVMRAHLNRLNIRQLLNVAYQLEPGEKNAVFKMIYEKATEEIIPELISRTAGRDHAARIHIVKILSKFNTLEVRHTLEKLLKDSNRQVRAAALSALGKMDSGHDIELIVSLLLDSDLDVQNRASELLIKLRHPETCGYLAGVLKDESEYSRRAAVEVLNEIADPESFKFLLDTLGDSDWWVRSRACDALATIGGPKVMEAVMQLVNDKDEDIRRSAVEILNQTKDEGAFDHLIKATRDPDWWVSERAVDALAEIGNKDAVPRLLEMLNENPKALPSVLKGLGKLGDTQVVPQIMPMFQRPEPNVIVEAIGALSSLVNPQNFEQARAQIEPLINVDNEGISTAARDAMEQINNRFSETRIVAEKKAEQMAEPAHTMLIDDSAMKKLAGEATQRPPAATGTTAAPNATQAPSMHFDIAALRTGDIIEGRYSYIEKIGKGAFGTVILVEDTVVDERLILKFLNPSVANDEEMLQRFVHELRFSRKITHPNVIRIYDFLKLAGAYAISMEYFPSHTLGAETAGNNPLPFETASRWAMDIATGMAVAHQVGIIHRDLKPANLLINDEGLLKIVDFGVAAAAGGGDTQLTKTGYVIGSPKYMAPEQILGKRVDHRADIYSTAVVFYEMLTGVPPYTKGDHMAVMYQHVQGKCARCDELNPDIPKPLADVVHKAMSVDKMERYESMDHLRKAISAVMTVEA